MAENRELALVLKLVSDQFTQELKNSQGALGQFNSFIKDWKTQLTAAGTALFAVAKSTANYGDELVKASQRMGTTVEDTARLQYAAKLSDTDLQGLTKTVGFLSKEMLSASTGNAEAQRTFERLGISVVTASGQLKGTTQVLLELNDKFRLMPDGPEKTALSMLSLGKTGKDVLPLLNSSMREAFAEADQLGLVMSEKDAKAAEHFNDEMTKLGSAIRGVTNDIGTALIPKFDAVTHALRTIIEDAHAAAGALSGLGKTDSGIGVVKPNEGGRNLRILPAPPGVENAVAPPYFQTPAQAKEQEEIGKRLTEQFIGQYRVRQQLEKEQEVLGRAKLEIFLAQNRANDIEFDAESRRNAEARQAMEETWATQQRIDDISGHKQEALGRGLVKYDLDRQQMAKNELADLAMNAQAWLDYGQQVGASQEFVYTHQMELVRANLAQRLDLEMSSAGNLLIAWQNKDEELARSILARTRLTGIERETIELQTLAKIEQANQQASDDVFEGWYRGMQRYVADVKSGFGMAADLARRTAQSMESSFRTFFFDLFEGKVRSFKDVLRSLMDFVKQVAAQIASQLAVAWILKSVTGGGGMFTGSDTGWMNNIGEFFGMDFAYKHNGGIIEPHRFAFGGHVLGSGNQDTVRALLTPGEGVLSRRGMATLDLLNAGTLPGGGPGNVTVNVIGAPPDSTPVVDVRRTTDSMVIDVLLRHQRDLRPLFGGV